MLQSANQAQCSHESRPSHELQNVKFDFLDGSYPLFLFVMHSISVVFA